MTDNDGVSIRSRANVADSNAENLPRTTVLTTEKSTNDNHERNNSANATNVNASSIDNNTLLSTLMAQNSMMMELLKLQQNKSMDITIASDLNNSIPVFNGLQTGAQALDWL